MNRQALLGRILKDVYRIDAFLGEGGPSMVFRGMDLLLNVPVAIKYLKQNRQGMLIDPERFLREARTQSRLVHQNIVGIRTVLHEDGDYFIIMEYVSGRDLGSILRASPSRPALPLAVLRDVFIQMLAGLGYAHREGVIHRDVKPANILVRDDLLVKVADFGIAMAQAESRLTDVGVVLGSPCYMAPEQIQGQEPSPSTDIYSAGISLYEMICGYTPFEPPGTRQTAYELLQKHLRVIPPTPSSLGIAIPATLEDVVLCALAKTANARFPDCAAFQAALAFALRDEEIAEFETSLSAASYPSTPLSPDNPPHASTTSNPLDWTSGDSPLYTPSPPASETPDPLEGSTSPHPEQPPPPPEQPPPPPPKTPPIGLPSRPPFATPPSSPPLKKTSEATQDHSTTPLQTRLSIASTPPDLTSPHQETQPDAVPSARPTQENLAIATEENDASYYAQTVQLPGISSDLSRLPSFSSHTATPEAASRSTSPHESASADDLAPHSGDETSIAPRPEAPSFADPYKTTLPDPKPLTTSENNHPSKNNTEILLPAPILPTGLTPSLTPAPPSSASSAITPSPTTAASSTITPLPRKPILPPASPHPSASHALHPSTPPEEEKKLLHRFPPLILGLFGLSLLLILIALLQLFFW